MKKILMIGALALAVCLAVSAVSAEVNINGSDLTVEGMKFHIPDGFKENQSERLVDQDVPQLEGAKMSYVLLENGTSDIVIKVVYTNDSVEVNNHGNGVVKTIKGNEGFLYNVNDTYTFDYTKDGKMVELKTAKESLLEAVMV